MILKLLRLPTKLFRYALIAERSNYPRLSDKLEIYFTLLAFYIKTSVFSKKTKNISQNIFGFKVYGYDYATLFSLYREIFVSQLYSFVTKEQRPKIIDCGANIGMAVLYFKKLYPDCNIIAFEPNPFAFKILQKNITENRLTNTIAYNIGLSDKKGTIDFYLGDEKGSLMGSIYSSRGGVNKLVIESGKLSEYIGQEKFDMIKIDVEGAEIEIIQDLLQSGCIKASKKYDIEYHHRIDNKASQLSSFLNSFEENGYDYNIKTDFKAPYQDLIIYFHQRT